MPGSVNDPLEVIVPLLETTSGPALTIGATNFEEVLDPVLLRPGRFDRRIYVPLPAGPARRGLAILRSPSPTDTLKNKQPSTPVVS